MARARVFWTLVLSVKVLLLTLEFFMVAPPSRAIAPAPMARAKLLSLTVFVLTVACSYTGMLVYTNAEGSQRVCKRCDESDYRHQRLLRFPNRDFRAGVLSYDPLPHCRYAQRARLHGSIRAAGDERGKGA